MEAIREFFGNVAGGVIGGLLVAMIVALCAAIWAKGRGPGPFSVIMGSAGLGLVLTIVSLLAHDNVWLVGTAAVLVTGLIGAWIIALRADDGR
ncbi:hypothetical protein [Promicromonospora panici]|uniref:hypothetical protein n=1 Tax=Promicromonospora panici TaxID=2219658 RepID=UPI00101C0722|nr:hypothetical protein [Promicromonospora panici]